MQIKQVFPLWTWLVYIGLFAFSIPWYLPSRLAMQLVLGLPFWLISCVAAIVCMAIFTLWMIHRYWRES